ncbi:MAG: ArnT family glycosyltransferase [Acidaminococcaceae bacterium]
MPKKYWLGLYLLVFILLFAYNGSLLITDSVESNYALTAKEMLQSGDWVSPQIYGNYWYDKPVMFYWLTAIAYKMFGFTEFASRFFPAVFGVLAVSLAAFGGKKLYSERAGFLSALVLVSSLEFFLISKSIITDSVLFLFFNAALLFFYLGYRERNGKYYYGTYVFCALATLTKGPIGFLLPGLIIFLFLLTENSWHELKNMKLFSGTLLFLAIAVPWYFAMYMMHGADFINVFFGTHNFLRATVSEHPRDNVIYYYTLVLILSFFPWVGLLPATIKHYCRSAGKWVKPPSQEKFLIIWAFTIFFFFQNMATKYLTYTYPMLFPLALLVGGWLDQKSKKSTLGNTLLYNFSFYLLLIGAAFWVERTKQFGVQSEWQLLVIAVIGMVACVYYYMLDNRKVVIIGIALTAVVFNIALIRNVCVPLTNIRSGKNLALELKKTYPDKLVIASYGDYQTSAVFYSDKKIVKVLPRDKVDDFKPHAYSWTSKNIMPYMVMEDLQKTDNPVIIVPKKEYNNLKAESGHRWALVTEISEHYVLKE